MTPAQRQDTTPALTDAVLAKVARLSRAAREARARADSLPVFVTDHEGNRFVNTGPVVEAALIEAEEAEELFGQALSTFGHLLVAEVQRLKRGDS